MIRTYLPYCQPSIDEEEIEAVSDVLKSGWLAMGERTLEFERKLAEYVDADYVVAVSSCTAALHLSLLALGIGKGDEVITTPFTFAATAHAIVYTGATPVFADIDKDTYNIDPNEIVKKITPRTKAIIPVHYAGLPCDMDDIRDIASKYNLFVIEDAAHAIGASYKGEKIGSISDTTCFSFYATKNMTTGEGGALATNSEEIATKIKSLRQFGMSRDAWKRYTDKGSWYYEITDCGWKYVTTDIQSALGIVQLSKLDDFINKRQHYAEIYNEALRDYGVIPVGQDHVYHLYPFLVPDRDELIEKMNTLGIGCSVHFTPLHLQPYYRQTGFPNAEWVYEREISLPLYPSMTESDIERVIECVRI